MATTGFKWRLVVIANLLHITTAVVRTDQSHSSYYDIQKNYVLPNHVINIQWTTNIMSCAQLCLANPKCLSVNFDDRDVNDKFCELNSLAVSPKTQLAKLTQRKGYLYAVLVDIRMDTFTFTNLGAKGLRWPLSTDEYRGTSLEGKVQLQNGIQLWDVPSTGSYSIEAFGASGGNGTCAMGCTGWKQGGLGARIKGIFKMNSGTRLQILVGQKGFWTDSFFDRPGGGGGGTFVVLAADSKPLIIAGGGGGGGMDETGYCDGDPGQASPQGSRQGGSNGQGGLVLNNTPSKPLFAGSGAGFLGNGTSFRGTSRALAFICGGNGGIENGGFGGGGGGMSHPGGGGGYSGGGLIGNETTGSAGGGGSYNAGAVQENEAGVNKGDGRVIITMLN